MHTSLSVYAKAGLRLGRAAPQRSLPPCGGGTGRGVATRTVREAASVSDSENQESWSGICPASDRQQPLCLLYPPPCPSPAWGEGTVRHAPSHLTQRARGEFPKMCACPSASAGTHNHQGFGYLWP